MLLGLRSSLVNYDVVPMPFYENTSVTLYIFLLKVVVDV